jgi:putative membrane protein
VLDLLLALGHHFLVFGLAAVLAAEAALVQPGMDGPRLKTLSTLDRTYGLFAVLILIVGFLRVFYGVRGPEFFLTNPWFWAKIACFVVVGILSAPPSIRFFAWQRQAREDGAYTVSEREVRRVRGFFIAEIVVFAFIPLFAAAMVRVPFL